MDIDLLQLSTTVVLVVAVTYIIKRLCGVGLFAPFPDNLNGFRWLLAQLNVFISIVTGWTLSKFLVTPLLERVLL